MLLLTSAVLSIAVGTFGAIAQNRIVRLMAYSAIAHMGFILLGFGSGSLDGIIASFVYIFIYIIMSISTFSIIFASFNGTENKYISDIKGLGKNQPYLAVSLALTLLSIAGIPPLVGFLSKFYVIVSLVETNNIIISIAAVVMSVVASYYYLKIIKTMFFTEGSIIHNSPIRPISKILGLVIGQSIFLIITLLIYPKPVIILPMVHIVTSLC
jgi:NADH-quinone oxidoreductase subunit N